MKKKIFRPLVAVLCVVALLVSIAVPTIIAILNRTKHYVQNLSYAETNETFLNPDQGFYRTAVVKVSATGAEDKSYIIKDEFQLYHLRFDISEFSAAGGGLADSSLSAAALLDIEALIRKFLNANKNVIVRFAYDPGFGGFADKEPGLITMLSHISQICSVLNKFPQTITAIEAGMIGPWGEMHTSSSANKNTINYVIDAFLNETANTKIPILVRTPEMIYNYINISMNQILGHKIEPYEKAYRLGLFNDGFLGSDTDLGTYNNRQLETTWASTQTNHLPFGGEVARPESSLHNISNCLPEMFLLNLSYLNFEWNDQIVQTKWQEQKYTEEIGNDSLFFGKTAYEYISAHMGYRFVLNKSTLSYSRKKDKLAVSLDLENKGFGNLNRSKEMFLLFVKDGIVERRVSLGVFAGGNKVNFAVNLSGLSGNYDLKLELSSTINGNSFYHIRFANNLWDKSTTSNLIGKIEI